LPASSFINRHPFAVIAVPMRSRVVGGLHISGTLSFKRLAAAAGALARATALV